MFYALFDRRWIAHAFLHDPFFDENQATTANTRMSEQVWLKAYILYSVSTKRRLLQTIDLVTVFDAILTSGQKCEKLQCLYENLMSNNFRKTAVLKKI